MGVRLCLRRAAPAHRRYLGLPDHGAAAWTGTTPGSTPGALQTTDPKFFTNTTVKDFRIKGYGKFNVIEEVAPKRMRVAWTSFAWDLNNPSPHHWPEMPPATRALGEVDLNGRSTTNPCFNNPDYRAFLTGKMESVR